MGHDDSLLRCPLPHSCPPASVPGALLSLLVSSPLPPLYSFSINLLIFSVLTVFERFFVWFIFNVSKVSLLYSSFAAVIIFLLWIYYSATVILLGAGIVKGKLIAEGELNEGS